jgi:copper chaperone CopZ
MHNKIISKAIGFFSVALLLLCISAEAQFSQARLQATGLTCALCSKSIHQALGKLPFIESVQPDLKSSSFDLRFKTGLPVSIASLRTAVEDAGFFIGDLTLQIERPLSEQETADGSFIDRGVTYQIEGKLDEKKMVQVIDAGFMPDKEFKRLASRFKYLTQVKSAQSMVHLLAKK